MDFFKAPPKTVLLFLSNVFPEDCPDENDILEDITTTQDNEISPLLLPEEQSELDLFSGDYSSSSDEIYEQNTKIVSDYDELPKYFINVEHWPKSVNRLCWSCNNQPFGPPWFIPIAKFKKIIPVQNLPDGSYVIDPTDLDYIDSHDMLLENMPAQTNMREVKALKPHGCFCCEFCAKRYIVRVNDPKIVNKWEIIELLNEEYFLFNGKRAIEIPEAEDPMIQMQYAGPGGITPQEYRARNNKKNVILHDKA